MDIFTIPMSLTTQLFLYTLEEKSGGPERVGGPARANFDIREAFLSVRSISEEPRCAALV
jgi:hypothetical protein